MGAGSKKRPLLNGDVTFGGAVDEGRLAELLMRAKGSGLGCWVFGDGAAGGEVGGLKLRPLNASPRPPKPGCCRAGGDCMAPVED